MMFWSPERILELNLANGNASIAYPFVLFNTIKIKWALDLAWINRSKNPGMNFSFSFPSLYFLTSWCDSLASKRGVNWFLWSGLEHKLMQMSACFGWWNYLARGLHLSSTRGLQSSACRVRNCSAQEKAALNGVTLLAARRILGINKEN